MVELPARMDRICVLARGVRVMEVSNPARGGTSLISHAHPSLTGARCIAAIHRLIVPIPPWDFVHQ